MKLVFLETSALGLAWVKRFSREQSQLDKPAFFANFRAARSLLAEHPLAGHRLDGFENVRQLKISHSPFSLIYTCRGDTIYIIDVRDQRGNRSARALRQFTSALARKHGL